MVFLCWWVTLLPAQQPVRVLFYNTENLFDAEDDSLKNDNEFLPDAIRRWTPYRYREKIDRVAKVILASGGEQVPDLVGLCEVENDRCLTDLTRHSPLREAGYRYVMTDSPDERGIDIALLYQRSSFKLIGWQAVRIPHRMQKRRPTRDILHVTGQVISGDTLDVLVCHAPSRRGGAQKSEPFRLLVAETLKHTADSVMRVRQHPYLIIMGDFNDNPNSPSIRKVLQAVRPDSSPTPLRLYNLMHGMQEGTYRYQGEWDTLDQIMVSGSLLLPSARIRTDHRQAHILRHPFLLEEDDKYGGDKPFRTYQGMKYKGGFSDHLPVCLDLLIRDDKDYYSGWSSPDTTALQR